MERSSGQQLVPLDDREWWTSLDEGYWQALLQYGEVAPESAPPVEFLDPLTGSDSEQASAPAPDTDGQSNNEIPSEHDEWQVAQDALEEGKIFRLKVSGANRGGLLVNWNGLQGFVPASHLQTMPRNLDPYGRVAELSNRIGDSLVARLIEVDPTQKRLVFSERSAQAGSRPPLTILNNLCPGDVCHGTVTNLTTFGAFVDLGGIEGLIHISELSWDRVQHPRDVLRPDQEIDVFVMGINPEEKRIALSLKRLRPDPWEDLESRYEVGELVDGTVTNVVNFGAFVRIQEGLEGLIHITELAEGSFMHPRNVVREGDEVRVRILNIDSAEHRMGLSLRQVQGV